MHQVPQAGTSDLLALANHAHRHTAALDTATHRAAVWAPSRVPSGQAENSRDSPGTTPHPLHSNSPHPTISCYSSLHSPQHLPGTAAKLSTAVCQILQPFLATGHINDNIQCVVLQSTNIQIRSLTWYVTHRNAQTV